MKSRRWDTLPTIIFILVIFYQNSSFFAAMVIARHYRHTIRSLNIGSTHKLFSYLSSTQGFRSPGQYLVRDYQEHTRKIILQRNYNGRICNFGHLVFASGGQNGNETGDKSDDKADDKKDDDKKNQKEEEEKRHHHHSTESRIPTYDEFARFRDSSRPPDSHYPPGPGYGRSGCSNLRPNLHFCIFIMSVSNFLV